MNKKKYYKKSNAKNFLLLVIASLFSFSVGADPIDESTALYIAAQKMSRFSETQRNSQLKSGGTMQLLYKSSSRENADSQLRSTEETVFFYVFGAEEGGFVIVAGDDRITPVLGYSGTSRFPADNMPPNLQWWLGEYEKQIRFAIENNMEPATAQLRSQSDCNGVEPLIKTKWNQMAPYNNEVVAKLGKDFPTGCVPTAVAQLMYFWANKGFRDQRSVKSIPAYTTKTLKISIPEISNTENFDWDNMKNTTAEYTTDAQKNAIARLMYDVGVAIKTDYDFGGSAASISVSYALISCFNYEAKTKIVERNSFNTTNWDNILREELDAGGPILYMGRAPGAKDGGHAFICDGYNCNDNTFHINWGWGGSYDGYFMTTALNPSESHNYNGDNSVIYNFKPNFGFNRDAPIEINGILYNFSTEAEAEISRVVGTSDGSFVFPDTVSLKGKKYAVTSIAGWAFREYAGLTSITIPEYITNIEDGAFYNCNNLTSIVVEGGNPNYASEDGLLYNKDKTKLMRCPETKTGDFVIREGVVTVGEGAFHNCTGLTSILIPNTVKTIANMAFSSITSVTSIVVPTSVTSIANGAFLYNPGLTEITLPFVGTSPEATDGNTFTSMFGGNAALKKVTISAPCSAIQNNAFNGSKLTEINLPNTITTIGDNAFHSCKALTSLTIPENVKSIGIYAFYGCNELSSIVIPESVTDIGQGAFYHCYGLTSVFIPKNVINIGSWAFANCGNSSETTSINVDSQNVNYSSEDGVLFNKDKTILIRYPGGKTGDYTIPGSVTTIRDGAFACCSTLTSVTIPPSVTTIEQQAFEGCINLASIDIPQNITRVEGGSAFDRTKWYDNQPDGAIYIGKVLYKFKGKMPERTAISLLEGTTGIGAAAFYNCSNLLLISIPESVSYIGSSAFYGCSSLTSISIPNNVSTIGGSAFYGCSSLTSITVPNKITAIEMWTFGKCTSLTSIVIPESVTSIKDMAFNGCTALNTVVSFNPNPVELPYYANMGIFDGFMSTCVLYVPEGSRSAYQNEEQWGKFNIMEMLPPASTDLSVVINGVTWATRNVDAPGKFAENPESQGMFYQWNRNIGWSATEPAERVAIDNWDTSIPLGAEWEKINDPSPEGYRVPDLQEMSSLVDKDKVTNVWITQNGMNGRLFIDKTTGATIFFPAASYRYYYDGSLFPVGKIGYYCSSTPILDEFAYVLYFDSNSVDSTYTNRRGGQTIRCVAANTDSTSISITLSETEAFIVWEPIENAEGYLLKIYKDKEHTQLERTLKFDANGQFVEELRSGSTDASFTYTLKDLLSGTTYFYTLETLTTSDVVLFSQSGEFTTKGETVGVVETWHAASLQPHITGYYSILGIKLSKEPTSGIYIIMYDNGKAEKVVRVKK